MKIVAATGNIGLGGKTDPAHPLHHASDARLTAGGACQNASSRDLKQQVAMLSAEEATSALDRLEPVRFAYKADPAERHVGFIAEDVPELVATRDRKSLSAMDIVAVLTRVVQEQQAILQKQQSSSEAQRQALAAQQRTIDELLVKIAAIERTGERSE